MKKLLALTLAVCMVLSLASVAFAHRNPSVDGEELLEAYPDKAFIVLDIFSFGNEHLERIPMNLPELGSPTPEILKNPSFGDTVYIDLLLLEKLDSEAFESSNRTVLPYKESPLSNYKKELKVSADWEIGGEYVEDVKLNVTKNGILNEVNGAVEIKTKDLPLDEEKDVVGTITIKGKKAEGGFANYLALIDDIINSRPNPGDPSDPDFTKLLPFNPFRNYCPDLDEVEKEVKIDVAFTLVPYTDKALHLRNEIIDENVVYNFEDGEEEEELNLYGNMGTFYVNTIGQGDLVIKADVEYNKGIEAIDKDAAYVYYNGNGATFNKIGTLYLNASYGDHLYKVEEDGTLKELDGNYDTDEDAFKLRTRKLGSYVIAEKELDLEKINAAILAK